MPDPYREPIENTSVPSQPAAVEKPLAPETKEEIKPAEKPKEIPQAPPMQTPPVQAAPLPAQIPPVPPTLASSAVEQDRQLKILVDMAFSQGIEKAVQAAKDSGDAYLLDKFHDTLVDELHQQLVERGKLKEA